MRSIWKGAISFGLVNIGVSLYSATEEHDFKFHQVHRDDGGRIRYKRVCSICGNEVSYQDIAKGYELEDGRMITLEPEDFDQLPLSSNRSIEVLEFVPGEQVDPIHFQKTYYLEPHNPAVRPYVLLREALADSGRMAVVKITVRQRETLAILRVREDILVLHTMLWPDEIRKPDFDFLDQDVEVRRQELAMATSLIDTMSSDFTPDEFTDDYRDALEQLIESKVSGAEPQPVSTEEEDDSDKVIDLMGALAQSVERAKSAKDTSTKAPAKASGSSKTAASRRSSKSEEPETAATRSRKKKGA